MALTFPIPFFPSQNLLTVARVAGYAAYRSAPLVLAQEDKPSPAHARQGINRHPPSLLAPTAQITPAQAAGEVGNA